MGTLCTKCWQTCKKYYCETFSLLIIHCFLTFYVSRYIYYILLFFTCPQATNFCNYAIWLLKNLIIITRLLLKTNKIQIKEWQKFTFGSASKRILYLNFISIFIINGRSNWKVRYNDQYNLNPCSKLKNIF